MQPNKIWYFLLLITFVSCKYNQTITQGRGEPHRPQFHFTPPAHWMNDPNGMVYFEGEYHLFYQYYPDSTVWGPMHWGHAVSKDMVSWTNLPIALYPDSLGLIFSGSAVVDWNNSSGFGQNGKPPLVAIFTQHLMEGEKAGRHDFQYQSIAYSNDRGRTWTKFAGNPVIPNTNKIHDFRDPKVIWDAARRQWLMVFAAQDHSMFWASKNLINWTHLSDFGKEYGAHGGVWECPDFFPLNVETTTGASLPAQQKWVLLQSINPGGPNGGSATQYFVGDFDGTTFTLDPEFKQLVKEGKGVWLDWGRDNYAGVTWSDIPKADGRRLFMGWMSNWDYAQVVPTTNWRSATTLPRELMLKKTAAGYRVFSTPVAELKTLRKKAISIDPQTLTGVLDLSKQYGIAQSAFEMELEIALPPNTQTDFAVALFNSTGEVYRVGLDVAKNEWYSDRTKAGKHGFSDKFATRRHTAPRVGSNKTARLHLFFDVASCELFADDGATVLTDIFFPSEDFTRIQLTSMGGPIQLVSCKVYPLNRAGK